jgi:SAM-dependent methyltransferase
MFPFHKREMPKNDNWLSSLQKDISETYLKHNEPWKQTGFLLGQKEWEICRKPIAECIEKPGSFLDMRCSNGYLLESITTWTSYSITPFGIDISPRLIELAKTRLPQFSANFQIGSAPAWTTPVNFDYVRTELDYILVDNQEKYINKVLNSYVAPNGKLLLTEYRTKKDSSKTPWINEKVQKWGFYIADQKSAFMENSEVTRVLVLVRNL